MLSVLLTAKNTLSTRFFSVKSRIGTHLGTNNAGFAAMTRTMRGLSNAEDLPVFKFDGIPSASVHNKQSCRVPSPPQATFRADVRPLGGQGGGQIV